MLDFSFVDFYSFVTTLTSIVLTYKVRKASHCDCGKCECYKAKKNGKSRPRSR